MSDRDDLMQELTDISNTGSMYEGETSDAAGFAIEYIKDLESRLAIYERVAEVFVRYEMSYIRGRYCCYCYKLGTQYPVLGEGKTPEEALKKALDEAGNEA